MARYTKAEQQTALDMLRLFVEPGDTVYTVLRSVAKSGMSRAIDVYAIKQRTSHGETKPGLVYLSGWIATYLDIPRTHDGAIRMSGAGMDMGYAIVHELSAKMFRNEDGSYSHDGAYALKHEWI